MLLRLCDSVLLRVWITVLINALHPPPALTLNFQLEKYFLDTYRHSFSGIVEHHSANVHWCFIKNVTSRVCFAKNLLWNPWETTERKNDCRQPGFINLCIYLLSEARRTSYKAGISQQLCKMLFSFCLSELKVNGPLRWTGVKIIDRKK